MIVVIMIMVIIIVVVVIIIIIRPCFPNVYTTSLFRKPYR